MADRTSAAPADHGAPVEAAPEPLGPDGSGATPGITYRPHLDGLRAVAVYLVVLFHAGLGAFEGGFIGVDVFFVLSGYLVTHLLLVDLDALGGGGGRIGFARFYARRFRRLLPAAAVTLIVTGVVWSLLVTPAEVREAVGAFRAAFLYVANWWFLSETSGYFATDVETNPVLHFWSLSIEEQYYLAWPLVLAGLFALGRRVGRDPRRFARAAVVVGMAASVTWAWHLSGDSVSRAYYGTDARAYQLLAGAALAMSPRLVGRVPAAVARVAAVAALIGLVGASTSLLDVSVMARGTAAAALTAVLIVGIERSAGPATALLSTSVPVRLGRISYGTYLWHWPVIVIARLETSMGPVALAATSAVAGTALAAASAALLERPVRRSPTLDARPRRVVVAGLATSLMAGIVIVPALDRDGGGTVEIEDTATGEAVDLAWEEAADDAAEVCHNEEPGDCHLHPGTGPRLLVVGDSQTWSFIPTFTRIAEERDLDLWSATHGGCNWERGLVRELPMLDPQRMSDQCIEANTRWYDEVIPAVDPDVVILIRAEGEHPFTRSAVRADGGPWIDWGTDEYWGTIEAKVRDTVAELRADDRRVIVIEPFPITSLLEEDPTQCLSGATTPEDVDACSYPRGDEGPSPLERIIRDLDAADDGVVAVDLDDLVCPDGPTCPAVIDGTIVRRDWSHLTASFVEDNRAVLEQALDRAGATG